MTPGPSVLPITALAGIAPSASFSPPGPDVVPLNILFSENAGQTDFTYNAALNAIECQFVGTVRVWGQFTLTKRTGGAASRNNILAYILFNQSKLIATQKQMYLRNAGFGVSTSLVFPVAIGVVVGSTFQIGFEDNLVGGGTYGFNDDVNDANYLQIVRVT